MSTKKTALEWFDDITAVEQLCGISDSEFKLNTIGNLQFFITRENCTMKAGWDQSKIVAWVKISELEILIDWGISQEKFTISDPDFNPENILELCRQLYRAKDDKC